MRAELLALTPDALAALTNRGLVKRATKEVDAAPPAVIEEPDGTVVARFAADGSGVDGPVTRLPAGGLEAGSCTCGAIGACRHLLGLILTYQRVTTPPGSPPRPAPPGPGEADPGPGVTTSGPGVTTSGPGVTTSGPGVTNSGPGVTNSGPAVAGFDPKAHSADPMADPADPMVDPADPAESQAGPALRQAVPATGQAEPTEAGAGSPDSGRAETGSAASGRVGAGSAGAGRAVTGEVPAGPPGAVGWSPGTVTDEQLQARVGSRLMTAARKALRSGYVARVRRPTAADPVPQVDLGSATVRFLVPHDLGFVHTDAVAGTRDDVLALAVWAFRAADERAPGVPEIQIEVGGTDRAARDGTGLAPALAVASALLRDGTVHAGPGLASALGEARRGLDAAGLRWPLLAVADLEELLAAYRNRGAGYRPESLAELLVELHARERTVRNGGSGLRSRVLGTEEAAETPLRRIRLESLGCRVSELGDTRTVEVFLAHADSSTVLVLRRSWTTDDDGPALARRRAGGVTMGALAAGNVVSESAIRSASRVVRLATGRLARTSASPSLGTWEQLPPGLFADSYDEVLRRLEVLPPRPVRPRVEAELVRALAIAEVRDVVYSPGQQRLDALVADASGAVARITAHHTSAAPGRLDALAAALSGEHGRVRLVSGTVRRAAGGLMIDPLAVAAEGTIVVPDLAAPTGRADSLPYGVIPSDPLADALTQAGGLLAEGAHRGLAHLPASFAERLRAEAATLTGLGLRRVADALDGLAGALGPDPSDSAVESWVDAALFVATASELR